MVCRSDECTLKDFSATRDVMLGRGVDFRYFAEEAHENGSAPSSGIRQMVQTQLLGCAFRLYVVKKLLASFTAPHVESLPEVDDNAICVVKIPSRSPPSSAKTIHDFKLS